MEIIQTPWGDVDFIASIIDGAGIVISGKRTALRVEQQLAEKYNIPDEVLFRALNVFDAYFFVGKESRWPMICIKELCADARYRTKAFGTFVAESAADAVRLGAQRAYIAACVSANIGEETARENIAAYLGLEKKYGSDVMDYWEKIFSSPLADELCGSIDAKDYVDLLSRRK